MPEAVKDGRLARLTSKKRGRDNARAGGAILAA
jgi:hypothetical protein